ncbi:response regulator transcription factor [Chengkuizengella axinellae]|uniref:Response regulator transcription factor n=1 Tax=Chengkuizengella axinellae TaxID=3064388 RepID=A0ABT9IVB4_9BACL|nr:response regulator transcription factor [Chengkuizengella sp. 2205SS18-9]MDP5273301.1 response regulator transcription factor [Chengkuizengella sp. 2205SS18-9]
MIRLLIVDDDPYIRESLQIIIENYASSEIEVLGTCANGKEAYNFIEQKSDVNVVLMDVRMPVCDGVEGTKKIKGNFPNVSVLILTTFDDDEYIIEALKNGANGYMLKNIPPKQIIDGIKSVVQGNLLIHPNIAKKLTGFLHHTTRPEANSNVLDSYKLSPTEIKIIEKISEGLSNKEISDTLFLSEGTIKNYITTILDKLSLRDRTQIAIFYLKNKG